jgi:uncharacterized protein
VKTLRPTAWNGIIKWAPEPEWAKLTGVFTLNHKSRFDPIYDPEFLDHLIDAFVFYRSPIHTRSEKARRLNPVKIYTIDTGLVNAMMFRNSSDLGPLLENMVYMHLRCNNYAVEYVTTRDGYETDFLARHTITNETKLIQVCWKISEKPTFERELRGLKKAMAELSIPSGEIVTWDDEARIDDAISITPAWKWLL